jgi:Ca2+-binding EF-hand superfamily protein/putative hemolysin
MARTFTPTGGEENKDIECTVCLEPWDDPVEHEPCGHVFCRKCSQRLSSCPECRGRIAGRKAPNRILMNMANAAEVKCDACGWKGTREASRAHKQCGGESHARTPQSRPPPRNQQLPPQPATSYQQPMPTLPLQQQQPQQAPYGAPLPPPPSCGGGEPAASSFGDRGPWTKYGLTQEEYDHIMTVFMTFDADDSGQLDRREIQQLARWLNYARTDQEIDAMFREMDTDRSNSLSMDEFCTWVARHPPDPQSLYGLSRAQYESALFAFHSYDQDHNGLLNLQEFIQLAMRQNFAPNPQAAQQLFQAIDLNGNRMLDLHEILVYMHRRANGGFQPPPQMAGYPPPMSSGQVFVSNNGGSPPPAPLQVSGSFHHYHHHQHQGAQPPAPQSQASMGGMNSGRPRTLDGVLMDADLGIQNSQLPVYLSVAPCMQGVPMARTHTTPPMQHPTWNFEFSLPVFNMNEQVLFRLYRATDNVELAGCTFPLAQVPTGPRPLETMLNLHPKNPQGFNASGARMRVRLSIL